MNINKSGCCGYVDIQINVKGKKYIVGRNEIY